MAQRQGQANPLMLVTMRFDGEQEFVPQVLKGSGHYPEENYKVALGLCPAASTCSNARCFLGHLSEVSHSGLWPATGFL